MTNSIQPDNRSGLQMALEEALNRELDAIEQSTPFSGFLDGQKMPSSFLPANAIERGVIDWSPDDSLQGKRDIVSQALPAQSLSCTLRGVRLSVEALGFTVQIKRLRPYVFQLEAGLNSGSLTEALSARVLRRVSAYKAARDTAEVLLAREGIVTNGMAIYAETGVISDCEPYKQEILDGIVTAGIAIQAETYVISDNEAYRG